MTTVTEADYALAVVKWLEKNNFKTYKEVSLKGGGSQRCDIIGERDGTLFAVEVKTSLNFKVLDQAWLWRPYVHYSYIAVPAKEYKNIAITKEICSNFGLGLIYIDKYFSVKEMLLPLKNPEPLPLKLYEEMMESVAGTSGKFLTPFKITCQKLIEFLIDKEPIHIGEALKVVEHHYKSHSSAVSALSKLIQTGIIPEINYRKIDGKSGIFVSLTKV